MNGRRDADLRVRGSILGERARWERLGYSGVAFAPAPETYAWMNAARVKLTTVADSGRAGSAGNDLMNLYPLAAAALYEIAFVLELGPWATWRN